MLQGNIAQGTRAAKVADGVSRGMTEHIVGHADQCVFFAKHRAVFTDKSQAVYVGVNDNAQVKMLLLHATDNAQQIILFGLWLVGKGTCTLAIQYLEIYTESLKQLGKDDATDGIDGINTDAELTLTDSFGIDQL